MEVRDYFTGRSDCSRLNELGHWALHTIDHLLVNAPLLIKTIFLFLERSLGKDFGCVILDGFREALVNGGLNTIR